MNLKKLEKRASIDRRGTKISTCLYALGRRFRMRIEMKILINKEMGANDQKLHNDQYLFSLDIQSLVHIVVLLLVIDFIYFSINIQIELHSIPFLHRYHINLFIHLFLYGLIEFIV